MGNIKKRTPNTCIHELTPANSRITLGLPVGTFSSNKQDLSHKPESRKTLYCSRTYNTTVGEHNYQRYLYLGWIPQSVSFLAYSLFQAQKTTNTHQANSLTREIKIHVYAKRQT